MPDTAEGRELALESFDFRAEHGPAALQHTADCLVGLGLELFDRGTQVENSTVTAE
jgi:hypothetical protein